MKKLIILGLVTVFAFSAKAQDNDNSDKTSYERNPGWYVGAQLGVPMGNGEFASWGKDKFHVGWNVGINGGYRFSEILSFGISANWGEMTLTEKKSHALYAPLLGSDGKFYSAETEGIDLYDCSDLMSRVFLQRYGLHSNINILGLIKATQGGKWLCEIVPSVYLAESTTDILIKADKSEVVGNNHKWHFGYGVNAQAMYALTDNVNLGLYVGFTAYTGKSIDGMPVMHAASYTPELGLKATWNFNGIAIKQNVNQSQEHETNTKAIDAVTISKKYKEAYEAQVKILIDKTPVVWNLSLKNSDLAQLKAACDNNMHILQENATLYEDSEELQQHCDEWAVQKRYIECYESCIAALKVDYNEESVNNWIDRGTEYRNSIPYGAFRADMTTVLILLNNYKESSLHLAMIINNVNGDVCKIRDLGNTTKRALNEIKDKAHKRIDGYDDYARDNISENPRLKELFDKYLADLDSNPICNSDVEKVVADMLGLDYEALKRGECTIDFNLED